MLTSHDWVIFVGAILLWSILSGVCSGIWVRLHVRRTEERKFCGMCSRKWKCYLREGHSGAHLSFAMAVYDDSHAITSFYTPEEYYGSEEFLSRAEKDEQ